MKKLQLNQPGKKNQDYLERIEIASPCKANWDEMSGDERMRMCSLCKLNVYNLSDMTKSEAEQFLEDKVQAGGRVCVKMYRRQDGTVLTDDCPVGLRKLRDAARRAHKMVASVVALVLTAAGVTKQEADAQDATNTPPPRDPMLLQGEMDLPVTPRQPVVPELGKIAVPPRAPSTSSTGAGGTAPGRGPVTLQVHGSLLSKASAWLAAHKSANTCAIRAVSSASVDGKCNQRELQLALEKFAGRTTAVANELKRVKGTEVEAKRLRCVEQAISLTGEGNCLYYLGRAGEATDKYEAAMRSLEEVQFQNKAKLVERIFANLNQAKRLEKQKLDPAALKAKLGTIPAHFSEKGAASGGIAWLSSDDGVCDFTEPLN